MKTDRLEAKARNSGGSSSKILIRCGDVVIQAVYSEIASCDFPIWSSAPIPVEIPPSGTKDFIVGAFSGSVTRKDESGDYPNIVKFPIYREQETSSVKAFEEFQGEAGDKFLAKMPLVALATEVSGIVDGKRIQTHSVLPIWHDGSSVLITLDWLEGECAEGTPNPEWHMKASAGLPSHIGLERLMKASRLPGTAEHAMHHIYMTPWLLGAHLMVDKGRETSHRIWQRQWEFQSYEKFSDALNSISRGLLPSTPPSGDEAA